MCTLLGHVFSLFEYCEKLSFRIHLLKLISKTRGNWSRGNMGDFPISSGGGQFTSVPLTLWYKFATRGCRWICYSNLRSNRSKVQTSNEFLFAFRLENANKKSFEVWTLLRLRNSCPAVPTWGGGILYTEFIQICTMFVVNFDRKHHIHLILLVFQTKFVSTGSAKSKTLTQPY
jgi:hypothetical protein